MKNNRGFTLIEILVAVLIIATALLGLVGLQAAGLRNAVTSYNRTLATQLAYSMADRMRANRDITFSKNPDGSYVINAGNVYLSTALSNLTAKTDCNAKVVAKTGGCTAEEIAKNDLFEWKTELTDNSNALSKTGTITLAAGTTVYTIAICLDKDLENGACPTSPEYTFKTDFQL
jgi:type IV pilus assembly protein PilV